MGSIGDTFPYLVPPVGSTDWATLINCVDELADRVSSPVPFSALAGNDLDLGGRSITGIKDLQFDEQSGAIPNTPGLMEFWGDEWYLVTSAGAIKVTDNGALNVTSVGGIAGDYGGVNPASARFVDLTQRYDFYDDYSTLTWGYVRARGFDIAAGATSTFRARLFYGGAGNLDFTLPPTIPVSNRAVLQVDSTGNITFNDTGRDLNSNLWLGTGEIKHTVERRFSGRLPVTTAYVQSGTFTGGSLAGSIGTLCTVTGTVRYPLDGIQVGWRVKKVIFYMIRTSGLTTTCRITKSSVTPSYSGAVSDTANTITTTVTPATTSITVTVAAPSTAVAGEVYELSVDARNGDDLLGYEVFYDVI
jgi:hypothetical protein